MVGTLLPKVCCELRGVLGLDLLEATVGSQSPICASRGPSSWEPGLQHRGNSLFLPLTTPSLLLHPGFPVTQVISTGAALGQHFEKRLVKLKLVVWYHQEDSLGNPTGKRVSWANKNHQASFFFFLTWGIAYVWIIITKLRITTIMWLLSHNDGLIIVLQAR